VVVVVGCVNENYCGGGGCLELSICECSDGRTEEDGGRRRTEDGVRTGGSHKEIESLNKQQLTIQASVLMLRIKLKRLLFRGNS
jgi:hypothetical protein